MIINSSRSQGNGSLPPIIVSAVRGYVFTNLAK